MEEFGSSTWSVILQKDARGRRIIAETSDPLIGLEESEIERSVLNSHDCGRCRVNDTGNEDGEEVEKALVDALPRIPRRPQSSQRNNSIR